MVSGNWKNQELGEGDSGKQMTFIVSKGIRDLI